MLVKCLQNSSFLFTDVGLFYRTLYNLAVHVMESGEVRQWGLLLPHSSRVSELRLQSEWVSSRFLLSVRIILVGASATLT